mmetsp:Transcript_24228/g.50538  ORF Transcript_24228/g.50538 Transcript_24228/m.50538 type:complete len:183 (-) Transcript_24228:977-1525(-)|eukprot:CAMPEP_0118654946 /NCGR_PEP_ID=MMETSP0785-20121206/12660_1 /TAXON_ID=91992 /ORGANISM="Bolidomonas pacifica, Strain CCMP 1866" /LENGTH=182 /DNA_ID=CAMNT_0006547639 /DNA_START=105 /DNA_END=653 /DNA_ORIENTATION=-
MGAAGSALNSLENEVAQRELAKPLDGSDVAHSGEAALEEVVRLRRELRQLLDKEEFKKRKNNNKWRRGSFGQIKKAEDYWDRQLSEKEMKEDVCEGKDIDMGNVEEELKKMAEDMSIMLADTPKGRVKKERTFSGRSDGGGLDDRIGNTENGEVTPVRGKRTKRRSFVLEKGLTLVDSDEED